MKEPQKQAIIESGKAFFRSTIIPNHINDIQVFISSLEEVTGCASVIDGIDIEFIDALDGRRKYCQLKAGPNSVKGNDVITILSNFKHLIGKTRLDQLPFDIDDLIVGVLFGDKKDLSKNYHVIDAHYPVYCGVEFWERLTGDRNFYYRLVKTIREAEEEEDTFKPHCNCPISIVDSHD